jgi:8-oxo-dGTP pyrophosphatase MutT (NUDIX family)
VDRPATVTVDDVGAALVRRGPPPAWPDRVPNVTLPDPSRQPAAVLCALFDEAASPGDARQAQVLLTRRSSKLRSHSHQVSFPGGRIDDGERPLDAALREAHEEVGLDPASVRILGELAQLCTFANPAPITPYVAALPGRPVLHPNPAEVERAFTVPLVELMEPEVYREELWVFPDGTERAIHFFELWGDTVWGATARMLLELLGLLVSDSSRAG